SYNQSSASSVVTSVRQLAQATRPLFVAIRVLIVRNESVIYENLVAKLRSFLFRFDYDIFLLEYEMPVVVYANVSVRIRLRNGNHVAIVIWLSFAVLVDNTD